MEHQCLEIVLASCNGQAYIAQQLQSIQQCLGYSDLVERVLVVDDASTDGTASIVKQFAEKDSRISWVPTTGERKGIIANFSRGLTLTRAPYVMLCDQDDVWLADKIIIQLELCHNYENRCGRDHPLLLFSDLVVVDANLQVIAPSFFSFQSMSPEWSTKIEQLLIQNVAPGCTFLLNRPLVDKSLPIPQSAVMHDWWLILVARGFGHILWSQRATVKYRQHKKNNIGAKRISWRQLLSLRESCRVATVNLRRQGRQANVFIRRYREDPALKLESRELEIVKKMTILSQSSLLQRWKWFYDGWLRKNNMLRNLGLMLVITLWFKDKEGMGEKEVDKHNPRG